MEFARYTINCRFTAGATLPEFKGSALRGAFGRALKRTSCALRRQSCKECILAARCVYFSIFETKKTTAERNAARTNTLPHPFVLEPPVDREREYAAGERFDLGLLLFGGAVSWLPYIVYSVIQMGREGIGAGTRAGRGRFDLVSVSRNGQTIFEKHSGQLDQSMPPDKLDLTAPSERTAKRLTVNLVTPLRLKFGNRFSDRLDFHVLVRACLRRISLLEETFGRGEPELDYRGLVHRAKRVKTVYENRRWHDITRYSSRQQTRMKIGGITGSLAYEGDLAEFVPLLAYCEEVHLGKQTAFGMGKVRISLER